MSRVKRHKVDNRALNAYAQRGRRRFSSLLSSILLVSIASLIAFLGVAFFLLTVLGVRLPL